MAIAQAIGDTIEDEGRNAPHQGKRGKWVPYLLMLPGLPLAVFFLIPLVSSSSPVSRRRYNGEVGQFEQTWHFANYIDVLTDKSYYIPLFRSFLYAAIATVLALAIGYPLAHAIAFWRVSGATCCW